MERFVGLLVTGGIVLVAGLWTIRLVPAQTPAWIGGIVGIALGLVALVIGIFSELELTLRQA